MEITDLLPAQVPEIAEMETRIFSDPWTEAQITSQLTGEGHIFLAAVESGSVLGYISAMYVLDEGYVGNVAVREDCRCRGVGQALVEAMTARAGEKRLAFLTLEVRESNLSARRLYARCGYKDVGLRKNYYEKPRENAVLMTLELNRRCK